MQKLSTLLAILLFSFAAAAQQLKINWQKYFGGSSNDYGQFVQPAADGDVIIISMVQSSNGITSYHGGADIWVAKLSPAGNIRWQKAFGGSGDDVARAYAYNKNDGTLVIAANSNSTDGNVTGSRGSGDVWLLKIDNVGNMAWQKTLGGSSKDVALKIINTSDGNYLLSAETNSADIDVTGNHGNADIWLVKLGITGNMIWRKCYGGSAEENGSLEDAFGSSLLESPAGSYIFSANTASSDGNVTGYNGGGKDAWLVKTDQLGNITWQTCIGGTGIDIIRKIAVTPTGRIVTLAQTSSGNLPGYHAGGINNNYDVLLTVFTSNGVLQKQKCFGGPFHDWPFDLAVINDTSFVFAAKVQNNGGDVTGCNTQDGFSKDIWVCRVNADTTIRWQKCLGGTKDEQQANWVNNSVSAGGLSLPGKGFILFTGTTNSNDGNVLRNHAYGSSKDYDAWVVCMDSTGKISWQNTIGNDGNEWAGIANNVDSLTGDYYFTGSTESYNNNAGAGGRVSDIFVFKIERKNTVTGIVYQDNNRNNLRDAGELLLDNARIKVTKWGTDQYAITKAGAYSIRVDSGKYQFSCLPPTAFFTAVPLSAIDSFPFYFRNDTINFALQPQLSKRDIGITIIPVQALTPDSSELYTIDYFNQGTDTVTVGTVRFRKDARLTFLSAIPVPAAVSGDTLIWSYSALKPFDRGRIQLILKAADTPVIAFTDTVTQFAQVTPLAGDIRPGDNTDTLRQLPVTLAAAPAKTENHSGYFYAAQAADSNYITYTIRYSNNTPLVIRNMVITDTLDTAFDSTSFQMLAATHPYTIEISNGRIITWSFDNIQLPPAGDADASNSGFISFRILLKRPAVAGAVVKNNAQIILDTSLPATTNTVVTEIR